MKKIILLCTCMILLFKFENANAQFNQSFDTSANVWDITKCDNDNFCTVSNSGFRKYDVYGNLIWERYYNNIPLFNQSYASITNYNQCRLVHTDDDGII